MARDQNLFERIDDLKARGAEEVRRLQDEIA